MRRKNCWPMAGSVTEIFSELVAGVCETKSQLPRRFVVDCRRYFAANKGQERFTMLLEAASVSCGITSTSVMRVVQFPEVRGSIWIVQNRLGSDGSSEVVL